jgi:hypothetical protein
MLISTMLGFSVAAELVARKMVIKPVTAMAVNNFIFIVEPPYSLKLFAVSI